MRRDGTPNGRLALTILVLACALAVPAAASAMPMGGTGGPQLTMQFVSYAPNDVTALAGDTVTWTNESIRTHTVTADDGSFDSGPVTPTATFTHRFDTAGVYTFHCSIHAGMTGTIDVVSVLLDPVTQPAVPNVPLPITGRAALPAGSKVTIEGDDGTGFKPVGTAVVGPDGTFRAIVKPATTMSYRALPAGDSSATDASPPQQVLVVNRSVSIRSARHGRRAIITAQVTPASPGSTVVLELRLKEHFGWWPVATKRLDRRSQARFSVPVSGAVPARVVLTLRDGVTPLVDSRALRVAPAVRSHRARAHARRR